MMKQAAGWAAADSKEGRMFLCTRTEDRFRLVYEGDPAVKSKKGRDPAWIPEADAVVRSGEKPDVMVCRPLNSDEVSRVGTLADQDPAAMIWCAGIGTVAIERGDGERIEDADKIREITNHPGNLESMAALAQAIHKASSEGLAALPFRGGGDQE